MENCTTINGVMYPGTFYEILSAYEEAVAEQNCNVDFETYVSENCEPFITPQTLNAFLIQPGINIQGICDEAGIAKQYLNRCRKNNKLPGREVLDKLVPVIIKYGFVTGSIPEVITK
jgi:hypothetical protein